MASDPGYGAARYRAHIDHLFRNLQGLHNRELEKQWCQRFIDELRRTRMQRGEPKVLAEVYPDLLERFELHLSTAYMFA